jgi:hypothetical protein
VARVLTAAILATLAIGVAPAPAQANPNVGGIPLCLKSWRDWRTTDGVAFKNPVVCLLYVVNGGKLAKFTTSTSAHTTHTRVDTTITTFNTQVLGQATLSGTNHNYTDKVVYDSTFSSAPGSAEVQNAFAAAQTAVTADLEASGANGQIHVVGPTLVDLPDVSTTAFVGEVVNHTETTTSTTTTPTSPATVTINTNTHTETFVDDVYQTTVQQNTLYTISGSLESH